MDARARMGVYLVLALQAVFVPVADAAPASGVLQFTASEYVTNEGAATVMLVVQRVGGPARRFEF